MPMTPEEQDYLKRYLQQDMYQDPEALNRAQERSERKEMMGAIGAGLNTISRAGGAQNLSDEPYKQMAAGGQQAVGQELARQKTVRDYLKDKADLGLKKTGMDLQLDQLKAQIGHQQAVEGMAKKKFDYEASQGSPAQQMADKKKAEAAADWDVTGRSSYNNAVGRMDSALTKLGTMEDSWGNRMRGRLGVAALSDEQRKVRQDILNAALPILKLTLPGTVSDRDMINMIDSYMDFSLSPQDNMTNIRAKMSEAAGAAKSQEENAAKYGLTGELAGSQKDSGVVTVISPDGTEGTIPVSQLNDALKEGYKRK